MEGDGGDHKGVMPNAFNHIFDFIAKAPKPEEGGSQFLVAASYLEIYNEEIRDLLGKNQSKRLEVHESPDTGVFVKDLTQQVCQAAEYVHAPAVKHKCAASCALSTFVHLVAFWLLHWSILNRCAKASRKLSKHRFEGLATVRLGRRT